jgi:hypothetical protein
MTGSDSNNELGSAASLLGGLWAVRVGTEMPERDYSAFTVIVNYQSVPLHTHGYISLRRPHHEP